MSKKLIGVMCFLILVLAACGTASTATGSSSSPTQGATSATTTAANTAPQPAHTGQTAIQIVHALKMKGLPIGEMFSYTADNDPNHLLGRPGQYTDKEAFKDTRIAQGTGIGVSDGGSVEVFASITDAQHRYAYLQALSTSGNALFAEYEYLDGVAILRVSSQFTPTQAKVYETAFKAI